MKYIISAGGTGGHIYPALAIINKIKENDKLADILYIGTTDRMESKIIPEKKIPYLGIKLKGLNRHNIFKNISVYKNLKEAEKQLKKEIKEFNPDIVIGVGGYITYPVIKVASKLGYKTIIHEQNSIPGLTNKLLSKHVNKICVSLPQSISYFPKEKTMLIGNPRSEEVSVIKPINKEKVGLSKNKKLIIIVMGSLGSKTVNEKFIDILNGFKDKEYEVVFVTGKSYYDLFKKINIDNVHIVSYLDNMLEYLKACDLIVSRAGASTIAEITVSGVPSILIPSPYVTNNHQYKNAKELEDIGASIIIEEKDLNKEKLISTIDKLINNDFKLEEMSKANKKLGNSHSATMLYEEIQRLIKEDVNGKDS